MNENMLIELQRMNEERYNKKLIDVKVREWIMNDPNVQEGVKDGVEKLRNYLNQEYYQSKRDRLEPMKAMDLEQLVIEVFVGVAYIRGSELFTSVNAQLAGRLGWDDKPAAIATMSEVLAVLCETNVFDITKSSKMASLYINHNFTFPEALKDFIENCEYLPPMVCVPLKLTNNYSSGYLTHQDSLVLGNGNHHSGDLCLDVLNIVNKVPLSLDTEFLSLVEEEPKNKPEDAQQLKNWNEFKKQSYEFYHLMESQGNRFYLTNKWDKRGRMYCQGYHLSYQGAAFKKAMIELADKEVVMDVPEQFKIKD